MTRFGLSIEAGHRSSRARIKHQVLEPCYYSRAWNPWPSRAERMRYVLCHGRRLKEMINNIQIVFYLKRNICNGRANFLSYPHISIVSSTKIILNSDNVLDNSWIILSIRICFVYIDLKSTVNFKNVLWNSFFIKLFV